LPVSVSAPPSKEVVAAGENDEDGRSGVVEEVVVFCPRVNGARRRAPRLEPRAIDRLRSVVSRD